jgi:hypothetical protein
MIGSFPRASRALGALAAATVVAGSAAAQMSFSIDYKGPSIGLVTEGDILAPFFGVPVPGPTPPPFALIPGGLGVGSLGLPAYAACPGHAAGIKCGVEVDALSYGLDGPAVPGMPSGSWKFSVSRFTLGLPQAFAPSLFSETPIGEAAADVFVDLGPLAWPPGAVAPGAFLPGNVGLVDGSGMAGPSPFAYVGLGLIEPSVPSCALPSSGDDLDALDYDGPVGFPVYFSLDGGFPDFPCGIPLSGSATGSGYLPGDILVASGLGALPVVFAPAAALGLGPTDDLDALALFENGSGVLELSPAPYAGWGGAFDMIVFSVRAGSPIVGVVDPVSGLPITPGDLLIPPAGVGPPQVYVAAENLGLSTVRSTLGPDDELDALDVAPIPVIDCNSSGFEDIIDIALGLSADLDGSLVPDECEASYLAYCTAGTSAAGCNALISSTGTASTSATSGFVVSVAGAEGAKTGILFFGQNGMQASPWGSSTSYQCVVPPVKRAGLLVGTGTVATCDGTFAQDLNARWCPVCPSPATAPTAGVALQAQLWYRDPMNTSNQTTSLSNALEVVPVP